MNNPLTIKLGMLTAVLLCSIEVQAGLGNIQVQSYLGQPLRAEIPITGLSTDELAATRLALASAEGESYSVDDADVAAKLRFTLAPLSTKAHSAVIRVSSAGPINDPYLHFTLVADSSSTHSLRDYVVLLDPVESASTGTIVQDDPNYADNNLARRYRGNVNTPPPLAEFIVAGNDSLRSAASRIKPRGVSLDQAMAALLKANPQVFNSTQHAKTTASLNVPSRRSMQALSQSEVARILGRKAPSVTSDTKLAKNDAPIEPPTQPLAQVIQAATGNAPAPEAPVAAASSAPANDLQQQVAAREQALKAAEERIATLESELKATQASQSKAKVKAAPVPPPKVAASEPGPSFLSAYWPLVMSGGATVVLLLLLGWLFRRRRKKASQAKPITSAAPKDDSVISPVAPVVAVAASESLAPTVSDSMLVDNDSDALGIDLDEALFDKDLASLAPEAPIGAPEEAMDDDVLASLFNEAPPATPAEPVAVPDDLEFDMAAAMAEQAAVDAVELPIPEPEPEPESQPEPKPVTEPSLLDFDFNMDGVAEADPAPAEGLESLYETTPAELELPLGAAQSAEDEALRPKLDLAKVYLDMGDKEGAREVLEDLIAESSGVLQSEAQALIASL